MGIWEATGKSDEWMTPEYIFDALEAAFDLDVAAPRLGPKHVPTTAHFYEGSLKEDWFGFVWMNPPYGGRNSLDPWIKKFLNHGNGIALVPDRTSAPWFQQIFERADMILFVFDKIKFEREDGTVGASPGNGSALFACGRKGVQALMRAHGVLGSAVQPMRGLR